jgi:hypothetical protein
VETPTARDVFAALFLELYGLAEPVIPLADVLHWSDLVRRLAVAGTSLDRVPTGFLGGYFYNTSTPVPTAAEIAQRLAWAADRAVPQLLVPTVRNTADAAALRAQGFASIPWVVEAICDLGDSLAATLRRQLGPTRYRGLYRAVKKAAQRYPAEFYRLHDVEGDPTLLETVAALHACNVRKYAHARNFYSLAILQRLCASPLGEQLVICLRRDVDSGEAVQASISLMDLPRRQLYHLVHGIFHERVAPGYNLFVATIYEVFAFAERQGIREVNVGRGAPEQKRRLGANRFILLNNWLLSQSPGAAAEIASVTARCRAFLGLAGGQPPTIGPYPLE